MNLAHDEGSFLKKMLMIIYEAVSGFPLRDDSFRNKPFLHHWGVCSGKLPFNFDRTYDAPLVLVRGRRGDSRLS